MLGQSSLGLSLDPGMGKTSTWLGAFTTLKQLGYVDKMLVVAPLKPMYGTWPNEIEKFTEFEHLTWTFLHGEHKHLKLKLDADIYFINPEGLPWLCENVEPHKLADVLCIDESTTFKRWPGRKSGIRYKAMKPYFHKFDRRWIGTGTICPNGLEDIFAQTYILDQGAALGRNITEFRKRWFYTEHWNPYNYIPLPNAFEEITEAVAPLYLQLNADDYLDLPELQVVDVPVKMSSKLMKVYKEVETEFIATLPDTQDVLLAMNTAVAGGKCRQLANGAVYVDSNIPHRNFEVLDDSKLLVLEDLLNEIGPTPTLIVYEFEHDARRIGARFAGVPNISKMSGECLVNMKQMWNAGKIPRMLIQSSTAHGLNLQGSGHTMVWFGLTWSWENYKQMIDRLRRQGQSASVVMVYRLLAENTLDEKVAQRLLEKQQLEQDVKDAIGNCRVAEFS